MAAEVAYAKKRPCCPFAATDMAFDRSFESFPLFKYTAALYRKIAIENLAPQKSMSILGLYKKDFTKKLYKKLACLPEKV